MTIMHITYCFYFQWHLFLKHRQEIVLRHFAKYAKIHRRRAQLLDATWSVHQNEDVINLPPHLWSCQKRPAKNTVAT